MSRLSFAALSCAAALTLVSTIIRAQSMPPPATGGKLTDIVLPRVDAHVIAGAVTLIADKDGVLDLETFGMADIAARKPMASDTVFWIASMTKPFTGTALMMLVEEGKVNVDDPVEKYLPEFKGQMVLTEQDDTHRLLRRPGHPITVRNILTHTSGLPATSPVEYPTLDLLPLATAVRSYAMMPLLFEPDSKYSYANAGLNTAARIIEVVAHQPYEDFLRTRLLEPLQLKDTTFWPDAAQIGRLAKTYLQNDKDSPLVESPLRSLLYTDLSDRARRFPVPAGGLFSTAADCGRFCRMISRGGELDGKRYLSEESVKTMTSAQAPAPAQVGNGLGWEGDAERFGHNGAYCTNMFIHRQTGIVTVMLVQHDGFSGDVWPMVGEFKQAAVDRFVPGRTP